MKFENVKVGDIVFIEELIFYGKKDKRYFTIPKKVERVSKIRFVVDGGRKFKCKDGIELGSPLHKAYKKGERYIGSRMVYDQTQEKIEFEENLDTEEEIRNKLNFICLPMGSGLNKKELNELNIKVEEIKEILTKIIKT